MSFFGNFWKKLSESSAIPNEIYEPNARNSCCSLEFGGDQIRVLLFRDCEHRGRKLIFDSSLIEKTDRAELPTIIAVDQMPTKSEGNKCKSDNTCSANKQNRKHSKSNDDEINLLSDMVLGTVAMAYKGPSFKIHSINSPKCLMFTKLFPASEHVICKQTREKCSDEALGLIYSSSGSLKTDENLSGNSLNLRPGIRKNATCSSTGSCWTADASPFGSFGSQTMDNNSSSSSSIGSSLSSLQRRRWLKMKSTSFNEFDCDQLFGNSGESSSSNKENQRHKKTRFGLAMLIKLKPGFEKQMESKLFEHVALIEGILDRLRSCCVVEATKSGDMSLAKRLYKATFYCVHWLQKIFMDPRNAHLHPLLWHDIVMNTKISRKQRFSRLHSSMEQMCRLLAKLDTKSTNFFLSTLVTAILTHHLGWIHSVASESDENIVKKWEKRYPYNPLWAQLSDLYGGNSSHTVHTVITASPEKKELINSTLSFASYFLRSGIVEKKVHPHQCCEEDVIRVMKNVDEGSKSSPFLLPKVHIEESPSLKMKKSGTIQKDLNRNVDFGASEYPLSDVKIVIDASSPPSVEGAAFLRRRKRSISLGNFEILRTDIDSDDEATEKKCKWPPILKVTEVSSNARLFHSSDDLLNEERKRSVLFMLGDEEKPLKLCESCEFRPVKMSEDTTENVTCEECGKIRDRGSTMPQSDDLEALLQDNSVLELPMTFAKQESSLGNYDDDDDDDDDDVGFTTTLMKSSIGNVDERVLGENCDGYTWGKVLQGFLKKKKGRRKRPAAREVTARKTKSDQIHDVIRREIAFDAKFPVLNESVDETFSILADLDACSVEMLSNKFVFPVPVGMSRLVSDMLEAFAYVWRKCRSPENCVLILESRLREMWLRSETLAQTLLISNFGDITLDKLTEILDVDAADLPLLLAIATTHTPKIAQSFSLSLV